MTYRVLLFTDTFLPGFKAGGPIRSVSEILTRLPPSIRCTVITRDRDLGDHAPYDRISGKTLQHGQHEIYYMNTRRLSHWVAFFRMARKASPDVLYFNSFWSPVFTALPILTHLLGLLPGQRILLAPRGEFSPGALSLKSAKKRAALGVWSRVLRATHPTFHASADLEAQEIRQVLPWAQTVLQLDTIGEEPRERIVPSQRRPRFVFLSRISPKKNLAFALEALLHVSASLDFDIYGPIEDKRYWSKCQIIIASLPRNIHISYNGPVEPDRTRGIFAAYDTFVFPTLGENFGHAIIESLSTGCPVLCSSRTPWTEVLNAGSGGVLDLATHIWASELERRAMLDEETRNAEKQATLDIYTAWRRLQNGPLALQLLLENSIRSPHPSGNTAGD